MVAEDYALDPLVVTQVSPLFPTTVETDSEWLRTCVFNLVNNAKKHGPTGRLVTVRMTWLPQVSQVRVTVTDMGVGPSPARSRTIWRGNGRKGGIGIGAIISYIDGLGGTYGNDNSSFWIQVPGGVTESSHQMKWNLQFVSEKAEEQFLSGGIHSMTIWKMFLFSSVVMLSTVMFLVSNGQFGETQQFALLLVVFVFLLLTGNILIVYFVHCPVPQWWARTVVACGIALLDIFMTGRLVYSDINDGTLGRGGQMYLPGALLLEVISVALGPNTNTSIARHLGPLLVVIMLDRLLGSFSVFFIHVTDDFPKSQVHLFMARLLHVLIVGAAALFVAASEKDRRARYIEQFTQDDLKRDLRIMELSAKSRIKNIQREASRIAAHEVSK